MEVPVKLLILALVNAIILPPSAKGQLIPIPQNVSACVIYQDNNISLNVQWKIIGSAFDSPSASYTIYYFSDDSDVIFNNSVKQLLSENSENRISDLLITNFTGQQIHVQVGFTFNTQELSRSMPIIVDIRPVYLASFAINRTGNITTLKMGLNLACDIESGATCIADIIPQNNNTRSNMSQRQIHNITDEDDEENLFCPQQVFLTFLNLTEGLEYIVQARLLSSEGDMIGQEFQTIISVPFEAVPEPTLATTEIATTTTTISVDSYIPTITSACVDSSINHYRLNITWQFDQNANLSKIGKFKILHNVDHKENPIQIYEYPDQTNTDVITNGLTFANHIPLFNITNTSIQVQVAIVANEVDNTLSEIFTTQECSRLTVITPTSGSEPSNPLSLLAIVVFVVVLVVIIIVAILVLIMIKKCLHKKTKKTQQPSVIQLSTVNNIIAADINIEGNPADVKTKSNPTDVKTENDQTNVKKNNTEKSKTENDPADIKMQSNPAYQTMKKEYYEVKDNYYY